ncbi:Oleoyl phosphatidylcholine desaturase [Mycena sanguinolenta]|uniref:Oleoyl phosphatidylcholine desaturase n=1 Tax=Mycena sanguinolenta TaxID=230812 RepID=A0A8H6XQM4_9AGAR|nr:Oleoyl phosphatidylcholine desaturase [Mycena sanguinolenta]
MATKQELGVYVVPDITVKQLLAAIPAHCHKRSALKSSAYMLWNMFVIWVLYKVATYADGLINPQTLSLPYPALYSFARFSVWALYGFWTGLFATGLWVVAHEAGHQAFSESKFINNTVGWILHSGLGVPYHSWRITHAKHHASTGHMTQDQVFVPPTRSDRGLKPFDPKREDLQGASVSEEVKKELWEALGVGIPLARITSSPARSCLRLISGVRSSFLTLESSFGSPRWQPPYTPGARPLSSRVYGVPYLWVNHWLVLITFLQHTDPLLPHYRAPEFNFARGALATLDRSLLGDLGPVMGWIGAHATMGISETHIAHHICSKIPHYNAWEASAALRKVLAPTGLRLDGNPGGWAEMYRVYKECKFVEDEGDVVFYKNAYGLAKMRPVFNDVNASDSGIEVDK